MSRPQLILYHVHDIPFPVQSLELVFWNLVLVNVVDLTCLVIGYQLMNAELVGFLEECYGWCFIFAP